VTVATLRLPYGPDVPLGVPSGPTLAAAAANVAGKVIGGGLADLTPMPSIVIHNGPQTTVSRFDESPDAPASGAPVLLVPPLAAPARCFDLRRGCSLVQHLVGNGRRTYLVDYGSIAFSDRRLGMEHWIDDVLPTAIETVAADGGGPVHIIAWCLGGILSLLTLADRTDLPVASVVAVASPFDYAAVPMMAPLRPINLVTRGRIIGTANRLLGGAPAPLVRRAFQFSSVDKWVTKPLAVATHLDDRDFLAQMEAVDAFTAGMLAYPGRTFGQLYHRFFRANDLADGCLDLSGRRVSLGEVKVPVLAIGGEADTIAPVAAVHHLGNLLTGAPEVRLETAPGGHLGVLTGRRARVTTWALIDDWLDRQAAPQSQTGRGTGSRKPKRSKAG
jgi:polyhydroxyalkanoate synthase